MMSVCATQVLKAYILYLPFFGLILRPTICALAINLGHKW